MLRSLLKNKITYKILIDVLFCMGIFVAAYIISEAILPGIVSNLITPIHLFSLFFTSIVLISLIGKKQDIFFTYKKINPWIGFILLIALGCIFFIAGLRYDLVYNILITFFSIITIYFFYQALGDIFEK